MSKVMKLLSFYSECRALLGGLLGSGLIKDGNPLSVHFVMFVPTIVGQGTLEQQGDWLGRAWNLEILGTYAQVKRINSGIAKITMRKLI